MCHLEEEEEEGKPVDNNVRTTTVLGEKGNFSRSDKLWVRMCNRSTFQRRLSFRVWRGEKWHTHHVVVACATLLPASRPSKCSVMYCVLYVLYNRPFPPPPPPSGGPFLFPPRQKQMSSLLLPLLHSLPVLQMGS